MIGDYIKFYRKKRRLTQAELAEKVGASRGSTISDIETGRRTATQDMLERIAAALGCELCLREL